MASAVGKLQFTLDVSPKTRQLLQPVYRSLVDFTQLPEVGGEWENYVNVKSGRDSRTALRAAQDLLRCPRGLVSKRYPDADQRLAGF